MRFLHPLLVIGVLASSIGFSCCHAGEEPQDGTAGAPPEADSRQLRAEPAAGPAEPQLALFEAQIRPLLMNACADCHGPTVQEGNIRIDSLDPNLHIGKDLDWWLEVYSVISKEEMPPADSTELLDTDRQQIVQWLAGELQSASIARRESSARPTFRRLTRYEFNDALQDLLGLPWDFAKDLPPEATSADGFQNNASMLRMSVSQFETYHRLAHTALSRATVRGAPPTILRWGISMSDASRLEWPKQQRELQQAEKTLQDNPEKLQAELARLEQAFQEPHRRSYYRMRTSGRTAVATWDYTGAQHANAPSDKPIPDHASVDCVAILPAGQWLNLELGNQLPDEGTLRIRVRAARTTINAERTPSMQIHFGWQASNEGRALLRISPQDTPITALPDEPQFYQWDLPLGEIYPRNSVRNSSPLGALPSPSEYIRLVNSSASSDEIQVDFVEVLAPVHDLWPPASHRRIFFESTNINDPATYAREILSRFLRQAWRRPIEPEELEQKMELYTTVRPTCESFEEAIIEVLAAALSSPHFLYVVQESSTPHEAHAILANNEGIDRDRDPRKLLTPHELATRLSLFLWCSIPDPQLLDLADSGQLVERPVLAGEVKRMLADPRGERFSAQFVRQWLNLELLDFLNFTSHLPNFDPLLKEAMQQEPIALFAEMLRDNESVLNFLHADYTMANERLARHYGIENVYGNHFRRIPLAGDFRRGGLLTQAGLLAMNADYPDSHPLKRGKWLLENLLNDPPPPPPPAVPQIDLANPEIAKMTLKERLEDHRNHPACVSCHMKIDPWGIAFENYDALGKWRDQVDGKPVDASSELYNQQTLTGMDGLKSFLLENRQDQFVRALVDKMTTFALGRPLTFADRADLDQITAAVRREGDGLATLVEAIASSELFQSK